MPGRRFQLDPFPTAPALRRARDRARPGQRRGPRRAGSRLLLVPLLLASGAIGPAVGQVLSLAPGRGQVRGEVTGPDGQPLVGISIVLSPSGRQDVIYATSTDDHGRYAFNSLVPSTYQIRADGQGFETVLKDGVRVQPPFRAITDFEMQPGTAPVGGRAAAAPSDAADGMIDIIIGRFTNAEGEAVMEGSITMQRRGHPEDVFYARTDPDGRFLLADVPRGLYDIKTRSPGLIPLHLVARELPLVEILHLRMVAPDYPLAFKGWIDDLLPVEVPMPPPAPRAVELGADPLSPDPDPSAIGEDAPADGSPAAEPLVEAEEGEAADEAADGAEGTAQEEEDSASEDAPGPDEGADEPPADPGAGP